MPVSCPTCKRAMDPPPEGAPLPFCSSRCKLIDLGNWLDGRYRIPGEPAAAEDILEEIAKAHGPSPESDA